MTSPVSFYYQTNTREVKNIYTAENIWAIHKPDSGAVKAEDFFYTDAAVSRDRRLRKNASGKYEVTLYFTAQASNPVEMTDPPNRFRVAELRYANLVGEAVPGVAVERECTVEEVESGAGTAGEYTGSTTVGRGVIIRSPTDGTPFRWGG
jgi:hypothetical protein